MQVGVGFSAEYLPGTGVLSHNAARSFKIAGITDLAPEIAEARSFFFFF